MKKIYFTSAFLTLALGGIAQSNSTQYNFSERKLGSNLISSEKSTQKPTTTLEEKALNVLWSDDFEGGTAPLETAQGLWTVNGTNNDYWTIGSAPHPLSGFGWSEQLSGKFLAWDSYNPNSDEAAFATTAVSGEVVSPTIDVSSATNSIGISFKTEAMYCCNFSVAPFYIAVSDDNGASWSAPLALDFGVGRNEATEDIAQPLVASFNLSSIVSSNSTTFKFKFIWDGISPDGNGQYNTHYFWLIDEVDVYEIPDNDLSINSSYYGSVGLYYHQIPTTQIAPIDFSVNVVNNGAVDQTNVTLNVDINSGDFIGSSTPTTIVPGDTDSLFLTTPFTPSAIGTYNVVRTLTQDAVDDIPTDNTLTSYTFDVNEFVYARDNNIPSGYTANAAVGFETGNLFDIFETQDVYAIQYRLSTGTVAGSEIYARLYRLGETDYEYVDGSETPFLIVEANMLNTVRNMAFMSPITLEAGQTYLAVIGAPAGNVRVSNGGLSAPGTSILYDYDDDLFYRNDNTPMVRLTFDPSAALSENELLNNVSVFPNPSTNEAKVEFNLANASDVTINVTDITGKTVETIKLGNVNAGATSASLNVANYATGIYTIVITTNETSVTSKLIKK